MLFFFPRLVYYLSNTEIYIDFQTLPYQLTTCGTDSLNYLRNLHLDAAFEPPCALCIIGAYRDKMNVQSGAERASRIASIFSICETFSDDQLSQAIMSLQQLAQKEETPLTTFQASPATPVIAGSRDLCNEDGRRLGKSCTKISPRELAISPLQRSSSNFLSLPAEIRNMIYREILIPQSGVVASQLQNNGPPISAEIFQICKQIYHEASSLLYEEARLRIAVDSELITPIRHLLSPEEKANNALQKIRDDHEKSTGVKLPTPYTNMHNKVFSRFRRIDVNIALTQKLSCFTHYSDVRRYLLGLLGSNQDRKSQPKEIEVHFFARCMCANVGSPGRPTKVPLSLINAYREHDAVTSILRSELRSLNDALVELDFDFAFELENSGEVKPDILWPTTSFEGGWARVGFQTWALDTPQPEGGLRGKMYQYVNLRYD